MKVGGFTIARNAVKFSYPVVESITSILPLCDEFVVAVGDSEDDTLGLIRSIGSPKIKVLRTTWDPSLREGGRVLAVETDKAFDALSPDLDWAFYLQADELVHERDHPALRASMERWAGDPKVEGLLFDYLHFYGSYDHVGDSRQWYRREVRLVRRDPSIRSYKDAQGFRKDGRKLWVRPAGAKVLHYGWVKPPEVQQAKQRSFNKFWHDDGWVERNVAPGEAFDYSKIDSLAKFQGTHPQVMLPLIAQKNWTFSFDPTQGLGRKVPLRRRSLQWLERVSGWRPFEYQNYRLL